jgi:predicted ferric reductase
MSLALVNAAPSEVFWYLGRSSGFVVYGLLAGSMALGLAISSRILDGFVQRGWFFEMHKFCSLVVVLATLLHVLVFIPDRHLGLSVGDLFIPLHAQVNPGPKVVAISTFYLMTALTLSFYITRWIGQKAWRYMHYASFLVMVGATIHAIWAGSDAQALVVRLSYFGVGLILVFVIFYRMLALRGNPARPARTTD